MAWQTNGDWFVADGEAQDILVPPWNGLVAPGTGWSVNTADPANGVASLHCVADGAQVGFPAGSNQNLLAYPNFIWVFQGWLKLETSPTANYPLLMGVDTANNHLTWYLEVDHDTGKIRFCYGAWGGTALTGWSTDALTTTAYHHVFFVMDAKTLGTPNVWVELLMEGVSQWTGYTAYTNVGDASLATSVRWLWPVVDSGCHMLLGDLSGTYSNADAPHASAVPKPIQYYQKPTAEGTWEEAGWTGVGDATDKYKNWDDLANDGDTTHNAVTVGNQKLSSDLETRATVGIGAGDSLLYPAYAPGPVIVHRYASGSKFDGEGFLRLGATDGTAWAWGDPTASYAGVKVANQARPGGGNWAVDDLDTMEMACQTGAGEHDEEWRVTKEGVLWAAYSASNPLTTTPSLPGGVETTPAGGPVFMGLGAGIL